MKWSHSRFYEIKISFLIGFLFYISVHSSDAQKRISITIDDIPNTRNFESDNYQSKLLRQLDTLGIPIAIFINEGLIYQTDSVSQNFKLLNEWIMKEYTTLGNHTFDHSGYSTVSFEHFANQIRKGETISKELAMKYGKDLKYFRFPYNDLGKDSIQHVRIDDYLKQHGYMTTAFTIGSSDWMYNAVYRYYLDNGNIEKAKEIGHAYVTKSIEFIDFYEQFSEDEFTRQISQIYLCHDNKLNADYLSVLLDSLSNRDYEFISLDEALSDKAYLSKDHYDQKWGVSWFYRWEENQTKRIEKMKTEPSTEFIEQEFIMIQEAHKND